jgi:hypothetical protein
MRGGLVSGGAVLRARARRQLVRRRVLRFAREEAARQVGKLPTLQGLPRAVAARKPPPYALRAAEGLAAASAEHGHPHVVWCGFGGLRSEHAGQAARPVSRRRGLAEYGRQCRRQVILAKRWLVGAGFLTPVPAGGLRADGHERGGHGWATGYAAGPAMGGPRLEAAQLAELVELAEGPEEPPERPAPTPSLAPEVRERRRRELEAALEGRRRRDLAAAARRALGP